MAIDSASGPSPAESEHELIEQGKRLAAEAAAALVRDEMTVGLGTGSTVAYLLPALASRKLTGLRCVATSPATERQALELGLPVLSLEALDGHLDIAIDGADQVSPQGWLIKGGGGAHTREKIVAAAASRFVVIVSAEKLVKDLCAPVPVELLRFGVAASLAALSPIELRKAPPSPDGGLIADYLGPIDDPADLSDRLAGTPGVIEHGLFAPEMVSEVLVGDRAGEVRRLDGAKPVL
jgi:ribose 5-phosphate isomerase A